MKAKGMFTCETVEWGTPQALFDEINSQFGFTLDPCATPTLAKCERYYTKEDNGLWKSWGGETVFMNPPYGAEIKKWMRKAYKEYKRGTTVVCLIPARTDTRWWHDYAMKVWPHGITFLKGRIKFERKTEAGHIRKGPAPFPSAIVVFKPQ